MPLKVYPIVACAPGHSTMTSNDGNRTQHCITCNKTLFNAACYEILGRNK